MNSKTTLLHLSLIQNVGPAAIIKLIEALSYERIALVYALSSQEIVNLAQLSYPLAQLIVARLKDEKLLNNELLLIEKHNITTLSLYDAEYPELLKNIHQPPSMLYVRGDGFKKMKKSLAVV